MNNENSKQVSPANDLKNIDPKCNNINCTSSPLASPKIESAGIDQDSQTLQYEYSLSASTIPGVLHAQNCGAIDWSLNGLLAYGCQNRVVIVDTKSPLSFCQTLHRHKHVVCIIKWSPLSNHVCLCSIDTIGMIIVWDVIESIPLTVILSTNENKFVNLCHWIHLEDNNRHSELNQSKAIINSWYLRNNNRKLFNDFKSTNNSSSNDNISSCLATNLYLLTFYQQTNTVIIYDADLGEPVTKWQIEFQISNILFNPFFHFNRCCDSSVHNLLLNLKTSLTTKDDTIYFALAKLDEFQIKNNDSSKEPRKIHLPLNIYSIEKDKSTGHYHLMQRLDKNRNQNRHLKNLIPINFNSPQIHMEMNNPFQTTNDQQQLIQIEYHKSVRNQLFLVFPRDIYLIDISIETIITVIPIERNFSRLIKIFSCSLRNAFYALHENGNLSFRLYQKKVIRDNLPLTNDSSDIAISGENILNVGYVNLCHSEPIRLTKQNKIHGFSMSPFDETRVAFLLSTGKIIFKSLTCRKYIENNYNSIINENILLPCLNDLIKPQEYNIGAFLVNSDLDDKQRSMDSIFYRMIVTDYISGLNCTPTVIRMCPALTLKNVHEHKPFLAVGDIGGAVQIWLLNNNTVSLYREFSPHSYSIAGIEWTNLTSLITFAFPAHNLKQSLMTFQNLTGSGNNSGKVTNELIHIDIETGKFTPFRTNHINDFSPIETIRVSNLRQYLIILFKHDDPFEIWDVKTLTLLRVMSKSLGFITAVEWSPIYNRKQAENIADCSDSENSTNKSFHASAVKENFVVISRELFHFSIVGNIVRELVRMPSDAGEGAHLTVTSIAWKSDQILFGDASGTLNLWDLKRKSSRTEATYRNSIKKIRFGPGRGNMKCLILYADFGVDVWDIGEFKLCSQLKYPRDINFKIMDVDWATSDLPIFVTSDGFVLITDNKLKTYASPINIENFPLEKFWNKEEKCCKETIEELNIDLCSFELRKKLIKYLMFEIPYKKCPIANINIDDNEDDIDSVRSSTDFNAEMDNNNQMMVDIKNYINNQILLSKLFSNKDDYDFWLLISSILLDEELDSHMDIFLENNHYRHLLQEKIMILEHGRRTYFHATQLYKLNLNLRNYQRAVQVLLESESLMQNQIKNETDVSSSSFYVDALKACFIAALQTNGHTSGGCKEPQSAPIIGDDNYSMDNYSFNEDSQIVDNNNSDSTTNSALLNETKVAPVVKLVATSLIANGHITEGAELLTIISKTSDACRYLQSSDRWLDSIWLAKSSLDGNECTEVMRRWCEYLIASKRFLDKQTALKIYLSRRQFSRVLRASNSLSELKSFQLAVLCIGAQLIDIDVNLDCLETIFYKMADYFFGPYDRQQWSQLLQQPANNITNDDDNNSDAIIDYDIVLLQKCWNLFFQTQKQT